MKKIFVVVFLVFSLSSFSQKFELGKVSVQELKEKQHPLDSSASASVLYKKGSTHFEIEGNSWLLITGVEVRLKVYSKEGYDNAVITIPYHVMPGKAERVLFSDAVTYNLSGDKIVKTKLKDDGIFVEDVTKTYKYKKATMPNVTEGTVIEYKYVIKSPFIHVFPDWYFQDEIPVNKIQYSVAIPQLFVYNRILNPFFPIKETNENYQRNIYLPSNTLTLSETKRTYSAENLPALKDESYVDNVKNYMSFVKHELASTFDFEGKEKKYATDWNSMTKVIYEEEDFGKEIKKTSYFKKDIDELLKDITARDEIINTIFSYVKNRMVWNGRYGYECWDSTAKAYEEKTGNVGEINLMLVAMLRYAGLNANPVLLSTRKNGHVTFVSVNSFNYVIAGIEGPEGTVLLDATNKNSMPDILPVRDLNGTGRLIRDNFTSEEVNLMPKTNSAENISIVAAINPDGTVSGQAMSKYSNYKALVYRDNYPGTGQENYISELEKELDNITISSFAVQNDKEYTKPVEESFSFSGQGLSDVIGNKIYISPMLFYTMTENPFRQEKRSYPVDFVFPRQTRYTISIALPQGYTVESLPQSSHLVFDTLGSFKFNIAVNANQIQVAITSNINEARIEPEHYDGLKEFYTGIVKKQTEKIVLVKK